MKVMVLQAVSIRTLCLVQSALTGWCLMKDILRTTGIDRLAD